MVEELEVGEMVDTGEVDVVEEVEVMDAGT